MQEAAFLGAAHHHWAADGGTEQNAAVLDEPRAQEVEKTEDAATPSEAVPAALAEAAAGAPVAALPLHAPAAAVQRDAERDATDATVAARPAGAPALAAEDSGVGGGSEADMAEPSESHTVESRTESQRTSVEEELSLGGAAAQRQVVSSEQRKFLRAEETFEDRRAEEREFLRAEASRRAEAARLGRDPAFQPPDYADAERAERSAVRVQAAARGRRDRRRTEVAKVDKTEAELFGPSPPSKQRVTTV